MSSLLEQAIVDAKALKEAAMKNAEATIIDKYSEEVKSTLNKLLEQDELDALLGGTDMGPPEGMEATMQEEEEKDEIAEGVPDAFTEDVSELDGVNEGDSAEVTIDFAELAEALKELREGVETEETIDEAECGPGERDAEETIDEAKGRLIKHPYSDTVEIRKDREYDEYTVKKKGASGTGYHTDDLADAKATAKRMAGEKMDEEVELDEDSIMEMVASMLSEEEDSEQLNEEASDCLRDYEMTGDLTACRRCMIRFEDDPGKCSSAQSGYSPYGYGRQGRRRYEEGAEHEELYEEMSDDILDAIMEKLTVDMGATLSGWAGRSDDDMKHQMELEMAHRRSTEVAEELEALKKAQEELVFENKKLKENLSNYQEVVNSLKENVQDVNLSNARLLYTNRTLRNTSLNERQKERIVEAISKAGSVEEAKTIHETLQSTVASTPTRRPQSLSEAINRPTSIIRASRKEEPKSDPFQERMRKLAGIN